MPKRINFITILKPKRHKDDTCYGFIPYLDWCELECKRVRNWEVYHDGKMCCIREKAR